MTVFQCGDSFDEVMTCIYDAWIYAVKHEGHDSIRIEKAGSYQPSLFDEYIYIKGDDEKARKLVDSIKQKISVTAYIWVYRASMSCDKAVPDDIYRFLIQAFKQGSKITDMLTEPAVIRLMEINRSIGNESHSFIEFARFTSVGGKVYICHLEPKSNVVELVAHHFADRMPSEHFIIIDDTRKLAAVHPKDEDFYMKKLSDQEYLQISEGSNTSDEYTDLWKVFFERIAIKQRENRSCQMNHLPLWKRKNMTEFI